MIKELAALEAVDVTSEEIIYHVCCMTYYFRVERLNRDVDRVLMVLHCVCVCVCVHILLHS